MAAPRLDRRAPASLRRSGDNTPAEPRLSGPSGIPLDHPRHALTVAEYEALPRPLRVYELKRLFVHLDMPYRLMAEWALATGMRRMELCALAV